MRVYELIEELSKYDKTLIITKTKKGRATAREIKRVVLQVSCTPNYPKGRFLNVRLCEAKEVV